MSKARVVGPSSICSTSGDLPSLLRQCAKIRAAKQMTRYTSPNVLLCNTFATTDYDIAAAIIDNFDVLLQACLRVAHVNIGEGEVVDARSQQPSRYQGTGFPSRD